MGRMMGQEEGTKEREGEGAETMLRPDHGHDHDGAHNHAHATTRATAMAMPRRLDVGNYMHLDINTRSKVHGAMDMASSYAMAVRVGPDTVLLCSVGSGYKVQIDRWAGGGGGEEAGETSPQAHST